MSRIELELGAAPVLNLLSSAIDEWMESDVRQQMSRSLPQIFPCLHGENRMLGQLDFGDLGRERRGDKRLVIHARSAHMPHGTQACSPLYVERLQLCAGVNYMTERERECSD